MADIIMVRSGVLCMFCHAQACIYKITKCPLPQNVSSERPCPDGMCVLSRETVEMLLCVQCRQICDVGTSQGGEGTNKENM